MTSDRPRLYDDLLVLVAPTAVAVALTACLWHYIRPNRPRSVPTTTPPSVPAPGGPVEPKDPDQKSTRSKERRRRGKDPFRDLLKGGKRPKALLKTIKPADDDVAAALSSHSAPPHDDTASSASRSPSPEPAADLLDMDRLAGSDDGSARRTTRNENTSVTSISDQCSSDACSQPDGTAAADAEASLNTVMGDAPSSPPVDVPRPVQADSTSGSCAKLVRARTRLRLSRMDQGAKASSLPLPDNVANSSFNSIVPCRSTYSTDAVRTCTPTNSRGSSPPPTPPENPASRESDETRLELAAMRNALEAARVREEHLRREAERACKERDELRWGWNEDANAWRRREAELQVQIHRLMHQLQAYVAVASLQASSGFSSPTSPRLQQHPLAPFPLPPVIQAQNSASAPAHVQALLASAPMLPSHAAGYGGPAYAGGMSPLLWSGLGVCVPNRQGGRQTPDSSASSSSRGRARAESASDESSSGDCEEDVVDEREEDINNVLADAILKRPESIRGLGRPPVRERMDTLKDPAVNKASLVAALP